MDAHPTQLLAAYALGILNRGEARSLEDHLNGCHTCAEALRSTYETLTLLTLGLMPERSLEVVRTQVLATPPPSATA